MIRLLLALVSAALVLGPEAALAHPGHGIDGGFIHGFAHPLGGIDHILAMVTVGIFAYQLGGRAIWLVPSAFVLMMAGGGVLGLSGVKVPFVELGIAVSVIVLGAIVALSVRGPVAIAMGLVGLFAIFHGYAHGSEMPDAASGPLPSFSATSTELTSCTFICSFLKVRRRTSVNHTCLNAGCTPLLLTEKELQLCESTISHTIFNCVTW